MLATGRAVFSIAMIGFGVVCLVFVDFIHQLQPVDLFVAPSTPGYTPVAIVIGALMIAAGSAIALNVRVRTVALVLAAMFATGIVLLQVPSAFTNPQLLRSPWWVRTFETVVLASGALILAGLSSEPVRDRWIVAGRILVGLSLPVFGILHLIYASNVATLVPSLFPWPLFWAYLTALANLAAGFALVSGIQARIAAVMVSLMYGTYVVTLHIPIQFVDRPVGLRPGLTSLFVAIGFCGTAMIVAGSLSTRRQSATIDSLPMRRWSRTADHARIGGRTR